MIKITFFHQNGGYRATSFALKDAGPPDKLHAEMLKMTATERASNFGVWDLENYFTIIETEHEEPVLVLPHALVNTLVLAHALSDTGAPENRLKVSELLRSMLLELSGS